MSEEHRFIDQRASRRLPCLVQTIAPASALHDTACELIHDPQKVQGGVHVQG